MGHSCQGLACFAMPTHQYGHVMLPKLQISKIFNFAFDIRKSNKIPGGKILYFRSYQQKTSREGEKQYPSHYEDFRYRHKCLVDQLLSQGYRALSLEKSFKNFYGRYQDLIEKYQRSVNVMVNNSFPG